MWIIKKTFILERFCCEAIKISSVKHVDNFFFIQFLGHLSAVFKQLIKGYFYILFP